MVVAVGVGVAVAVTGGAAAPLAAAGAEAVTVAAAGTAGAVAGGTAAAAGAIATGAATGAVAGAASAAATGAAVTTGAVGGAAAGATTAAMTGGAAAAAASGAASGAATGVTVASSILSGPVGWLVLGAAEEGDGMSCYTWDCWKDVVRDKSPKPSAGLLLRNLINHPHVRSVESPRSAAALAHVVNVWGECFDIHRVYLASGTPAAHACRVAEQQQLPAVSSGSAAPPPRALCAG